MTKNKKPKIFDDELIDKLCKLPDLFYGEDLDRISPAKLVFIMNALDDASDHINDYLTESNHLVTHCYPDISDQEH